MKKIKLQDFPLLTKAEMKKISGGYGCCQCYGFGDHTPYVIPANGAGGCETGCTILPPGYHC